MGLYKVIQDNIRVISGSDFHEGVYLRLGFVRTCRRQGRKPSGAKATAPCPVFGD